MIQGRATYPSTSVRHRDVGEPTSGGTASASAVPVPVRKDMERPRAATTAPASTRQRPAALDVYVGTRPLHFTSLHSLALLRKRRPCVPHCHCARVPTRLILSVRPLALVAVLAQVS